MRCPLLTIASCVVWQNDKVVWTDCQEGACAWWDMPQGECAVLVLARMLVGLHVNLHNISEALPFKATL